MRWTRVDTAALIALLKRTPKEKAVRHLVVKLDEGATPLSLLEEAVGPASLVDNPAEQAIEQAVVELEQWLAQGIKVISLNDPDYPAFLRGAHDLPPLIFARGDVVSSDRGVAIVGSRRASTEGLYDARDLANRVAAAGLTVVAGLAAGIDTAAHRAAIDAGGRTVAVIGTGIRKSFPKENQRLHVEIADHGAVISQFWPDDPATKTSFPARNATMSGYSLLTVIVEASERSGTRHQARQAIEHGRPVVLLRRVADSTEWGRNLAHRPDVHVAEDTPGAWQIINDILNRPRELDELRAAI